MVCGRLATTFLAAVCLTAWIAGCGVGGDAGSASNALSRVLGSVSGGDSRSHQGDDGGRSEDDHLGRSDGDGSGASDDVGRSDGDSGRSDGDGSGRSDDLGLSDGDNSGLSGSDDLGPSDDSFGTSGDDFGQNDDLGHSDGDLEHQGDHDSGFSDDDFGHHEGDDFGKTELKTFLTGAGALRAEVKYEEEAGKTKFQVEAYGGEPGTVLDVAINGAVVASLALNQFGGGKIEFTTQPHELHDEPFPADFPTPAVDDVISVGDMSGALYQKQ